MMLEELTGLAWERFVAAGGGDRAAMSVAVMGVLAKVLEVGPSDCVKADGFYTDSDIASDAAWNECNAAWRLRIGEMMR